MTEKDALLSRKSASNFVTVDQTLSLLQQELEKEREKSKKLEEQLKTVSKLKDNTDNDNDEDSDPNLSNTIDYEDDGDIEFELAIDEMMQEEGLRVKFIELLTETISPESVPNCSVAEALIFCSKKNSETRHTILSYYDSLISKPNTTLYLLIYGLKIIYNILQYTRNTFTGKFLTEWYGRPILSDLPLLDYSYNQETKCFEASLTILYIRLYFSILSRAKSDFDANTTLKTVDKYYNTFRSFVLPELIMKNIFFNITILFDISLFNHTMIHKVFDANFQTLCDDYDKHYKLKLPRCSTILNIIRQVQTNTDDPILTKKQICVILQSIGVDITSFIAEVATECSRGGSSPLLITDNVILYMKLITTPLASDLEFEYIFPPVLAKKIEDIMIEAETKDDNNER